MRLPFKHTLVTAAIGLAIFITMKNLSGQGFINIDVDSEAVQRVIGEELINPAGRDINVYRTNRKWVPGSLAVYLDGKRCSRRDYLVHSRARDRYISFLPELVHEDSVVIVDYTVQ